MRPLGKYYLTYRWKPQSDGAKMVRAEIWFKLVLLQVWHAFRRVVFESNAVLDWKFDLTFLVPD
jgi:hypothetical protein